MNKKAIEEVYNFSKKYIESLSSLRVKFKEEFDPKTLIEKNICALTLESIDRNIDASFNTITLISEINNAEDEIDLKYLLEKEIEAL